MGNSLKVLFAGLTYDNLKIAALLLAICSLVMLNLFSLATVSPFTILPFDDIVGSKSNIFFTYFLDFSGVISSVLLVSIFIGFILFQLVMVSSYMNDQKPSWIVLIFIAALGFYGWVSYVNPNIQKLEDKYLTSYKVGRNVYSDQYDKAYGIVGSERLSLLNKAYLNAQISADQYNQYQNRRSEDLLKADARNLDAVIKANENNTASMDVNVIYKIYKISPNRAELTTLQSIANKVDQKAYFYSVIVAVLYILALFNLVRFREKTGMR